MFTYMLRWYKRFFEFIFAVFDCCSDENVLKWPSCWKSLTRDSIYIRSNDAGLCGSKYLNVISSQFIHHQNTIQGLHNKLRGCYIFQVLCSTAQVLVSSLQYSKHFDLKLQSGVSKIRTAKYLASVCKIFGHRHMDINCLLTCKCGMCVYPWRTTHCAVLASLSNSHVTHVQRSIHSFQFFSKTVTGHG